MLSQTARTQPQGSPLGWQQDLSCQGHRNITALPGIPLPALTLSDSPSPL